MTWQCHPAWRTRSVHADPCGVADDVATLQAETNVTSGTVGWLVVLTQTPVLVCTINYCAAELHAAKMQPSVCVCLRCAMLMRRNAQAWNAHAHTRTRRIQPVHARSLRVGTPMLRNANRPWLCCWPILRDRDDLAAPPHRPAAKCQSDMDCSLNGRCDAAGTGNCSCLAAWRGPTCAGKSHLQFN